MSSATDQDLPELEEKQLCVSCTAPNDPFAHFCVKCGAPLSSYASTGPFERLFAEGSAYRQAAERPRSFVVVLGVWLIFGMLALAGMVSFLSIRDSNFVVAILGALLSAVSLAMIWRTTRNYLARKQVEEKSDV